MEENSEKNLPNDGDFEDFKDFDADEVAKPEIEAEEINQLPPATEGQESDIENNQFEHEEDLLREAKLIAQMTKGQDFGTLEDFYKEDENAEQQSSEANSTFEDEEKHAETIDETEENNKETLTESADEVQEDSEEPSTDEPSKFIEVQKEPQEIEHLDTDNQVFKKYIFYVSKDFVPVIDNLSTDERTAYINDAIQKKVDSEYEYSLIDKRKRALIHVITMIITFIIVTPLILFLVHKSIMLTFENYKYSQDNFEKLYKQRFEKDRAYMRSLEYNRLHNKDYKKEN